MENYRNGRLENNNRIIHQVLINDKVYEKKSDANASKFSTTCHEFGHKEKLMGFDFVIMC